MKPAGGWTDEFLESMRRVADPAGDAAIDTISTLHGIGRINQLLASLSRAPRIDSPGDVEQVLRTFVETTSTLPEWYDPALIALAEERFYEHGLTSVVALFYSSLPFCYAMPSEAEVLQLAGQLRAHTERRIRETARMIFAVMDAGGMATGGAGVAAIQKVRLVHATIRHLILHRDGGTVTEPGLGQHLASASWDADTQGLPINQGQLAYTLLTFGYTFVNSSRKLGVVLSDREALAYLHIWNVAGHVLGVRRDMMAESWDEARELFAALQRRNIGATDNGRMLAAALTAVQEAHIPVRAFKCAGPIVTRYLVGDDIADMLAIRPTGSPMVHAVLRAALGIARGVDRTGALLGSRSSIMRAMSRVMARHIVQPLLADQTKPLVIRDQLLDRWSLQAASSRPGEVAGRTHALK